MAIRVRRGTSDKFDKSKLVQGELSIVTDNGELYFCFGAGNTRKLASKEDLQAMLDSSETSYEALQQLIADLETNPNELTNILANISALQSGKLDKTGNSQSNTVTFLESATDEDIASGDTHSTLFGKIMKSTKSLRSKIENNTNIIGLNLLDYGATGNDDFINDTAINNAINDAITNATLYNGGVEVIFPVGVFRISTYPSSLRQETITTLKDLKNITIRGQGKNTVIKGVSDLGFDVLQLNGVENLNIKDLSITSVKLNANDTTYGVNGISITNGTRNIHGKNIYVYDLPYVVKTDYVDGGKALTVQQGSLGISNCENIEFEHCSSKNVAFGFECSYDGQEQYKPNNIHIHNNDFECFYRGITIGNSPSTNGNYIDNSMGDVHHNTITGAQQGIVLSRVTNWNANDNILINTDVSIPTKINYDNRVVPIILVGVNSSNVINNDVFYAKCDNYLETSATYNGASTGCNVSFNNFTGHCIGVAHNTSDVGGNNCNKSTFISNTFKNYDGTLVNTLLLAVSNDNMFFYGSMNRLKKLSINTSGDSNADLAINGTLGFAYTDGISIYTKLFTDAFAIAIQQTGSSNPLEKVFEVKNNSGVNKFIITANGAIRSDNYESSAVPTSQNKRIPWYGTDGTLLGYIPLYN